jgi:hypothetical protein
MNTDLKPGKGCHLVVNDAMLEFVSSALFELGEAYNEAGGDPQYDESPKQFFQAICKKLLPGGDLSARIPEQEWSVASDNFGDKLIAWTEYPDGECRVTLVLTKPKGSKKPELKLDIRPWIEY